MKLGGMEVFVSPFCSVPRFTLSLKVPVTPEFREEFNKWALEFFGAEDNVIQTGNKMYVSQRTYDEIRNSALFAEQHQIDFLKAVAKVADLTKGMFDPADFTWPSIDQMRRATVLGP